MQPSLEGATPAVSGSLLERFAHFEFGSGDLTHRVFHAGDPKHPPILLMPEIAGLSPGLLMFAGRLMDARFQVYMPWLFGAPGKRAPVRNAIRLCVSREFANLRAGVSAPVTTWLRALARHISERNGGTRVGAIGMCLTGAFAIPLVIDPAVVAAVAAQPSVPLSPLFASFGIGRGESLGQLNVSESDIAAARARLESGSARLFALRCRADRICPAEKLDAFAGSFPWGSKCSSTVSRATATASATGLMPRSRRNIAWCRMRRPITTRARRWRTSCRSSTETCENVRASERRRCPGP